MNINILRAGGGGKIKYIKLPHRGLSSTLNSGFNFAKGEYIARMDADDISLPDRFKLQVEFLENNPTCSVVGGFVETFGDKEEVWKYPKQLKYLELIKGCFMAHPTIMLRRDDFNKYNLRYKTNILCEDYELWSRAIRFLNFCNIQEVLLKYRIHGDNLSLNPEIKNSDFIVRDNMLNFLTDDVELKEAIMEKLHPVKKKTFLEQIFSIRNVLEGNEKYKELCIAGLNFKIKKY